MEVGARRPIPARELALSRAAAQWLSDRRVDPDVISIISFLFAAAAGAIAAVFTGPQPASGWAWVAVAILVELRLLANMLDGMVAVGRGISSKHGELYNEVPDRLSDLAVMIGLGYGYGGDPALGYVAGIGALLTAYVRALGSSLGAVADFRGPMAKPHRMHLTAALAVVCALGSAVGWDYAGLVGSYGLPALVLALIAVGTFATAGRRLARIARNLK